MSHLVCMIKYVAGWNPLVNPGEASCPSGVLGNKHLLSFFSQRETYSLITLYRLSWGMKVSWYTIMQAVSWNYMQHTSSFSGAITQPTCCGNVYSNCLCTSKENHCLLLGYTKTFDNICLLLGYTRTLLKQNTSSSLAIALNVH